MYDVSIIGGGLAGLSLAIILSKKGYKVLLLEKENYPFQKVCGEFLSNESKKFLQSLEVDFNKLNLPEIRRLKVSSPEGKYFEHDLDLGGFGISRYFLDNHLKEIAIKNGVDLKENCKVENIEFKNVNHLLSTSKGIFESKICCGAFGKKSNIDVKLKRSFLSFKRLNNYVGVKYHVKLNNPDNLISLHNFEGGYCGLSNIEDNKSCLCYLTTAKKLKKSGSIENLEKEVLSKNKFLQNIFENCEKLTPPITISQISFSKKNIVENHILFIGDAAGMITPLCGNGMSMALRSSVLVSSLIEMYLENNISRSEMEISYLKSWKNEFSKRLATGRIVQQFFGKSWQTNSFIKIMKMFPFAAKLIIKRTHGKEF